MDSCAVLSSLYLLCYVLIILECFNSWTKGSIFSLTITDISRISPILMSITSIFCFSFSLIWHLVSFSRWTIVYFEHTFFKTQINCLTVSGSDSVTSLTLFCFPFAFLYLIWILIRPLNFSIVAIIGASAVQQGDWHKRCNFDSRLAFFLRIHIWKSA